MSELDELDFVAVEIHTAGADPASVCAVDMALVRGGEIVAAERWPVRPPTGPASSAWRCWVSRPSRASGPCSPC